MIQPTLLRAAALVALYGSLAYAGLTVCPRTESTYVAPNGINLYTTCPGSDYIGGTASVISNVKDTVDCLYLCADRKCDRAVYEPSTKKCHIKIQGYDVEWVASSRYDAIRLRGITVTPGPGTNPPATGEGSQVDKCPTTEKQYTAAASGKKYAICTGHDFKGEDTREVGGILTVEACAALCATDSTCTKAAWEKYPNYICHLKKPASGKTVWTVAKALDAIREIL